MQVKLQEAAGARALENLKLVKESCEIQVFVVNGFINFT